MTDKNKIDLSPIVIKVLDEYLKVLCADEAIDSKGAERLDAILRNGKVPKLDDIDTALFPPPKGDKP